MPNNMTKADVYMKETLERILNEGYLDENPRPKYADGVPAHTLSINHVVRTYDIGAGEFPITTLRPIAIKSAIKEIFWIYQDQSNDLDMLRNKYNVKYWNEWESQDLPGTIGIRYGEIVRRHNLVNNLLDGLKNNPFGRRHIIDLYQYTDMDESDGLNPCAFCTIWNVRVGKDGKKYLDVSLIQRSGDSMAASCCGVNECQYSAFLMMVARHCGYEVGKLTHYVANEQIYDRHIDHAKEMIRRFEEAEKNGGTKQAKMTLNPAKTNFYDFTIDDFVLEDYNPIKPQLTLDLGI